MRHFASAKFWARYNALPLPVRALADRNYKLLRTDSRHPSLHFKRISSLCAVRVGEHYRALGIDVPDGFNGSGSARTRTTIN